MSREMRIGLTRCNENKNYPMQYLRKAIYKEVNMSWKLDKWTQSINHICLVLVGSRKVSERDLHITIGCFTIVTGVGLR